MASPKQFAKYFKEEFGCLPSEFNCKNGYGGGRNNSIKSIITRSGHTLIFDDTEGGENIILKDKSGNELMFKTSEESIEITAQESLFLNAKKIF